MTRILEFFKCVVPDGLKPEEYFALLHILHEEMSFRAVASTVGTLLHKDYIFVLNDAYGAGSPSYISNVELEDRIRQQLLSCGWLAWLEEPPDPSDSDSA